MQVGQSILGRMFDFGAVKICTSEGFRGVTNRGASYRTSEQYCRPHDDLNPSLLAMRSEIAPITQPRPKE